MNIISLGAGVQSSTMALMAAKGELTPMPVAAIFADTGDEPASVYKWLDWLETQLPFPTYRVKHGEEPLSVIASRVRLSKAGNNYTKGAIPAFTANPDGKSTGLMMRQCTSDFKIIPIQRKIRELSKKQPVTQWIGIAFDEVIRMKPSRIKYITNRWPLVEKKMTRQSCLAWMAKNGYPIPPRSACVFCPYHRDSEWQRLKVQEPEEFLKAVEFEKSLQGAMAQVPTFRGKVFLHRSLKPISEVVFVDKSQPELFNNECEGMCGV